ncbi:hypothetical protein NHX12_003714 [Muraenolepis orangiensis]|uniref:GYF domain-containing protein n=1 Tax=Muraenolepis orangiensis TaxID=630683 RepID=A0A9Q0DXN3_9TELE|nr:hypothetical protein NHX12_003714 [Muraenolepis orangiensis]
MAETQTLNFGPEWLRALSGGGSSGSGGGGNSIIIASPPLSPALPKYKLADYRYGREEMLALYVKDNKIPIELHDKEFMTILQEEPLPPLALVSFTEEEQRNFSMSVNSSAVLRLTGRGGGPIVGAPRGRSTSRGRGRGRGDGGFYQRSFDDVDGGFGRGAREMHRSQSWEERRFEKPGRKDPEAPPAHFPLNHIRANYEEVGPGPPRKHDFTRSESENWRCARDEQNGSGSMEDERDSLPEWCLEDAEEETGTFDSSGAFLSLKKASKERILEEAELDFRPLEECDEEEDGQPPETKETQHEAKREADRKEGPKPQAPGPVLPPSQHGRAEEAVVRGGERRSPPGPRQEPSKAPLHVPLPNSMLDPRPMSHIATTLAEASAPSPSIQRRHQKPMDVSMPMANSLPFASIMAAIGRPVILPHDVDEDEGLKHFEQEAEKMVAYLQEGGVDEERLATKKAKPTGFPLTHEAALKWFYKDPQGEMQGPFNNHEMTEWFQAGYFTMSLLVKRGCDDVFQPLGEIMKMWGRVPFASGAAPPPLQADGDQERLKRHQELTALNLYQLQQLQYQYLIRQQYAQALAQQKAAALSSAPQYQALKLRASESLITPVTRSLSVPDSGSVWEMQNQSSQASCTPNLQQNLKSSWDGSSVWDLPIDSMAQAPTIEQMQQIEKAKAAKSELERRDAEMRAKRGEEEDRKRLEEAMRSRQQEERNRLEEEERLRHKQEDVLRRQREQQEEAQRRQEEERQAQEDTMRRLEERLREEEERKQREEFLRKQLPSSSKWGQQSSSSNGAASQNQSALSLSEIQKLEEERERLAREEQRPARRHQNRATSLSSSVWGAVVPGSGANWGSEPSSIWGDTQNANMGFWDEAVKENNKSNANLSNSVSGRSNKKAAEEEEKLLKLFQAVNKGQQDGFMQWCEQSLHTLNTANNLDVPTFASFLKEVDSPYEVHDYVRAYLGDTPEAKEFAKQFLERRAKQNGNQQKQAPQNQQQAVKQQQQKESQKKQSDLLGFSVNAASERLNMGEIETADE